MKLKELQDKLFDMLCVVDDICKKENVRYYLDSGTEIGAVREHNFIPWDDDMDIKIMAEDYPAFKKAMEENLPEYMRLIEPDMFAPGFYDFIIRICDMRYTIRPVTEEDRYYKNLQNYVCIDVFLLCYVPGQHIGPRIAQGVLYLLYGLSMGHRYTLNYSKYSTPQKLVIFVLSIIGKVIPVKFLISSLFRLLFFWNRKERTWLTKANIGPACMRLFCPEYYTGKPVMGEIRGRKFPVPSGYDAELRIIYGDYLTPVHDPEVYIQHILDEDMEY